VNNPLASISSLAQSLLSGEGDSNRQTTLHTILSQISRISGTLKDLVNFARPSTTQRKAVNVNELINETLRLVTYNKRFGAIRIERELAADLRPAFADDNEIQQVLLNLLFNAADATCGEGSRIRVVTENLADRHNGASTRAVVLRIIDNGVGIPPDNLNRVFDPFFTTKPAGSGVGLGLSLCQRIILSNRGSIHVQSEVGKGTTVTIALPTADSATQTQLASAVSVQ
ncbi:MAG: sensor histidine kinase, partial [Candidatus Binataceae bacterium]